MFFLCESLTSVTIPESVTSIGEGAFGECFDLTSVVISEGVTSIGVGVFYGCTSLSSIIIPDSVTTIGDAAFNHCISLTSVNFNGLPPNIVGTGVFIAVSATGYYLPKFAEAWEAVIENGQWNGLAMEMAEEEGTFSKCISSFGVNFTSSDAENISTTEGAGFSKDGYAKPITWGNFKGSVSGKGTMTVDGNSIEVSWTSRGIWTSGADKATDDGKLLYGYLDDVVGSGRTKATVKITGLPSDKRYAMALILSGDGETDNFNGKYSPALINGETYSYLDGILVIGDAAKTAATWGNRRKPSANGPTIPIEGQNVMFVENLSGSELFITSAMDATSTSRLTIAGVQVWIMDDSEGGELGGPTTWTNATGDGKWETVSNWSSGVPTFEDTAVISVSDATTLVLPEEGVSVAEIIIESDAKVTLSGGSLTTSAIRVLNLPAFEINNTVNGDVLISGVIGGVGRFTSSVKFDSDAGVMLSPTGCLTFEREIQFGDQFAVYTAETDGFDVVLVTENSKTLIDISKTNFIVYADGLECPMGTVMSRADGLYVLMGSAGGFVEFNLGAHGYRIGGGNLLQIPTSGIIPPTIKADNGWVFTGWDVDPKTLIYGGQATAQYKTLKADLYVESVTIPESVQSGETLSISWVVGNRGYSNWDGVLIEQIRLLNTENREEVIVIADSNESISVVSDNQTLRSYQWSVPIKGVVGSWIVEVETAIASTIEYGGDNCCQTIMPLLIKQKPLPDISIKSFKLNDEDIVYLPKEKVSATYVVQNTGTANVKAPWHDALYIAKDGVRVLLATIEQTKDLAPGETIEKIVECEIPELITVSGEVAIFAKADFNDKILELTNDESAEDVAWESISNATLGKRLYLSLASSSARENQPNGVRFYVTRSGELSKELNVSLTTNGALNAIDIPHELNFGVGVRSIMGTIVPSDNYFVDGNKEVTIIVETAEDNSFMGDTQVFTVLDDEVPSLFLSFDKAMIREGEGVILVTVTRELATNAPLTVYLTGVSSSQCTYPTSVEIPAGEASYTFELGVINNKTAEIDAELSLRASANGYTSTNGFFTVEDDDVPSVTLELYPEEISEGAGATAAYAILSRVDEEEIGSPITVTLTPSIANQLIMKESITIPAYTKSVRLPIGVIDNNVDEGDRDREVELKGAIYIEACGCSGQPSSGDVISAVLRIIDNDVPALSLLANPSTMKEGVAHAGNLILSHNSVLSDDLIVALSCDIEGEITIPSLVTIPAGEVSVEIPVETLDDGKTDGGQLVSVYAIDESGIFARASTWIQVSDQNLPDVKVEKINLPKTVVAGKPFEVEFLISNIGFVEATGDLSYAIHLIGGKRGSVAADINLVTSGKISKGIVVGGTIATLVTMTAPLESGDYEVVVTLDPDGRLNDLDNANDTLTSSSIAISAAYTATLEVEKEVYLPSEEIRMSGTAIMADGVTPAINVPIEIYVIVDGTRRTYTTVTDQNGMFSMTYLPASSEAGSYAIGACYPGLASSVSQDVFDILGMRRMSSNYICWDLSVGDSETKTITLSNRSSVALTDLKVSLVDVPKGCDVQLVQPSTLPGNGVVALEMTVTAVDVTEQVDYCRFSAKVESAEGVSLEIPLYFHAQAQQAYLHVSPAKIDTTMTIGGTRYVDVVITNDGKGDTGKIDLCIPNVNWLRIVGGNSIANLQSQQTATITLEFSPTEEDNLVLNAPLYGSNLVVDCVNGQGVAVPLKFTPVSESTGGVQITATDNNTYYLESKPYLSNAKVLITNIYTGAVVATGLTDENGVWNADGIPEGRYQLTVTANKHSTYADEIIIEPGRVTKLQTFLQNQVISATWEVVKTEIEDAYTVDLCLEYETQVPAPIVKVTIPDHFETLEEGECIVFTAHVENTGVIAAERVHFAAPEIPNHNFTFLENDFKLAAGEARDITVKFEHVVSSRKVQIYSSDTITYIKTWLLGLLIDYICGDDIASYSIPLRFRYGEEDTIIRPGIIGPEEIGWPKPDPEKVPSRGPGPCIPVNPGGDFKIDWAEVQKTACRASSCTHAIVSCVFEFLLTKVKLAACITLATIDCGIDIYGTATSEKQTPGMIASTVVDCGLGFAGCFVDQLWFKLLGCGKGILESCFDVSFADIVDYFLGSSRAKSYAMLLNEAPTDKEDLTERFPRFACALTIMVEEIEAIRNWQLELFGDESWLDSDGVELTRFLNGVKTCLNNTNKTTLLLEDLSQYKPSNISNEVLEKFVSRMNRYLAGEVADESTEPGQGDIFNPSALVAASERIAECEDLAAKFGHTSAFNFLQEEGRIVVEALEADNNAVCASVKLQLSQTYSMTREAFDGTLTMFNGHETVALTDLKLDISILDADGNECKDLFEIIPNGTTGAMSEGSVLEGGLSVTQGGTGSANIRFIPHRDAAPIEEKVYRFGGSVTYTDPFTSEKATMSLTPVTLTVSPSPYLHLDYFVQRDVYADDPFTSDVVEASMPAELAVLIRNVGAADARNVTVASIQPEVVENEKGLATTFALKDYTLDEMALNGELAYGGLKNVTIGTIAPTESKVAQWWLTSSIEGHFIGMSATVAPVNTWNTPDTMLVDPNVGVHKLVRSIYADSDTLPDFLVCDYDMYGIPNEIYTAKGAVEPVMSANVVSEDSLEPSIEADISITLIAEQPGWNYGYLVVPHVFNYTIAYVERADGTILPLRNAWITDRTFRDGATPLLEERIHLVDDISINGEQSYKIHLVAKPSDVPMVESFDLENGQIEYTTRDTITVTFSKSINLETFTINDLQLRKQGVAEVDLSALSIVATDSTNTTFKITGLSEYCSDQGRYELVVQCAGIADFSGQLGTEGKRVSWMLSSTDAPYIVRVEGVSQAPVKALDCIFLHVSAPAKIVSPGDMEIKLNGVDVKSYLTITSEDVHGIRFSIAGLEALQLEDTKYTLVIEGSMFVGLNGKPGISSSTVVWQRDTTNPTLLSVAHDNGIEGNAFTFSFTEDVLINTMTLDKVTLHYQSPSTFESKKLELPKTAKIKRVALGVYQLTGCDSILRADGLYTLTVNSVGIMDEAGNEALGQKSVTWKLDTTPPEKVVDVYISSEYGSIETGVFTTSREFTLGGVVPEQGVTVSILAKYANNEILLVEPNIDENQCFTSTITLPNDGSVTIVIRLTDAQGLSSDTEVQVYVDVIPLLVTITGASEGASAVDSLMIEFDADPEENSVITAPMSLTLDGQPVDIDDVTISKESTRVYIVTGLAEYTKEFGSYQFTYDARCVKKMSSGMTGASLVSLMWSNVPEDVTPPTITKIRFDGIVPKDVYVESKVFTQVAVQFSEVVNVADLISRGLEGQVFSIQALSETYEIVKTFPAKGVVWDAISMTATWQIDPSLLPCGRARLVIDASLVEDVSGNSLVTTDNFDVVSGMKTYMPIELMRNAAYSYACPTLHDWNNDGLLDLFVGEKTQDNLGKVRIYLNRGTKTSPRFEDYVYLQKNGTDVEFTAQGCVGMQIAFGNLLDATMVLADSSGKIYGWDHLARSSDSSNAVEWELWFDHSTDERFSSLIRTQVSCYDFDNNGYDDILVSGQNSQMFWMERIHQDTSAEIVIKCNPIVDVNGDNLRFPEGQNHTSAVMTDVNGDAIRDLVTGDSVGNVWVYYGTDNMRFTINPVKLYENSETGNKRSRLAVGDLTGDGVDDILVGRQDGSIVMLQGVALLSPAVSFKCVALKSIEEALNDYIYWLDGATGWTCEQFGETAQAKVSHLLSNDETCLTAKIMGAGTVTFTWGVSGENADSTFKCIGDESEIMKKGPFTPITQSITFNTEGQHLVKWIFTGLNDAIVRDVSFVPANVSKQVTTTSEVPIPFADIHQFANQIWKQNEGDYERTVHAIAANGMTVMENCIAGLESSDVDAAFHAKIAIDENGIPKISWTPALNGETNGEGVPDGVRVYKVYGKESLKQTNWESVTPENKMRMQFFKVTVEMP